MKRAGREFTISQLVIMAGALSTWNVGARAQAPQEQAPKAPADAPITTASEGKPEEVVVIGRSFKASDELIQERLTDPSVVDTIGAEAISRLGDSTVAASLRRVPGLSLVSDKFVYIRGLGERYSATSLNGSDIPSPDLTRNVIPLDIFPTSVVESVRVQKAWSPDLPANFGGGSVNIRSKGIPDRFELNFELSSGLNTETSGDALSYRGGDDDDLGEDDGTRALSPALVGAISEFQGDIGVQNILTFVRRAGNPGATLADAQALNRSLALELNRDVAIEQESTSPDLGLKASIGNRVLAGENWELGFLVGGTYDNNWREATKISRHYNFPTERTDTEEESTHSVNISATGSLGLNYADEQQISTTSLFVRNTDDETAIRDFFNENREISDGSGFRNYRLKFEERNLTTHQIQGTHRVGPTTKGNIALIDALLGWIPEDVSLTWFYSESKATTDIPNEATFTFDTVTDPSTAAVLGETVALQSNAADYRFTDLEDRVRDNGWSVTWPIAFGRSKLELKGGGRHSDKVRQYRQVEFGLGPLADTDLTGSLDQVFSDANILDPANNFVFARQGTNNQSYLAATMTDSIFGIVDWTYDERWRMSTGARWEDYRQVALDWNPFGFSATSPQVTTDPEILRRGTFASDEWYPAASLTYTTGWLAETFQVRLGWSDTVIRPDLRELTDASYIDPITDILTRGNPGVVPADVSNYDLRAELRFSGGDSITVTFFNKEIDNPIEFFESAASDTTIAREIVNAESAEVRGVELEGLKSLGFLGGFWDTLFVQGNLTVQESELVAGPNADAPTNPERELAGASEYVLNFTLGFDAPDGKHTASLIYNVFGERLFTAGRNGAPDAFEQPFHSLDLTYSWYPTDSLTFKLKAQNLLDEQIEIKRENVITFEQDPGSTLSLSASYSF
jgi:outer membrane receptor protein involved in Fe transport